MIIDMRGEIPTPERVQELLHSWATIPGYMRMFGPRFLSTVTGRPVEEFAWLRTIDEADQHRHFERQVEIMPRQTVDDIVTNLTAQGIDVTCIHAIQPLGVSKWDYKRANDQVAEIVRESGGRVAGFAVVDPFDGQAALREIERSAKELGLKGFKLTPVFFNRRTDDPVFFPLYAKCAELDLPIWLHCANSWFSEVPMDTTRPIYLDRVACVFPNLKLIAGHGGWPWVQEMVVCAWRHPNVYIELSAHRPKYFSVPGSGWEPLLHFGNNTVQDKVLFGSTWEMMGMRPQELVQEYRELPVRPKVVEKWLGQNAARLLNLG